MRARTVRAGGGGGHALSCDRTQRSCVEYCPAVAPLYPSTLGVGALHAPPTSHVIVAELGPVTAAADEDADSE